MSIQATVSWCWCCKWHCDTNSVNESAVPMITIMLWDQGHQYYRWQQWYCDVNIDNDTIMLAITPMLALMLWQWQWYKNDNNVMLMLAILPCRQNCCWEQCNDVANDALSWWWCCQPYQCWQWHYEADANCVLMLTMIFTPIAIFGEIRLGPRSLFWYLVNKTVKSQQAVVLRAWSHHIYVCMPKLLKSTP